MKWKIVLILAVVVVLYLVLGSVAFHFLESVDEHEHQEYVRNVTNQILDQYSCLSEADIHRIARSYMEAYSREGLVLVNRSSTTHWDIASAIVFSITVITTIGYGNMYPVTTPGQIFCVVYAIVGIPLCLVLLAEIGQKFRLFFDHFDKLFAKRKRRNRKQEHVIKLALIIILGAIIFLILPAVMFSHLEDWTYAEAFYYCVISLTTIGFGDLIPGHDHYSSSRVVYHICIGLWIFVGLAWLAGLIRFLQHGYVDMVDKAHQSIRRHTKASLGIRGRGRLSRALPYDATANHRGSGTNSDKSHRDSGTMSDKSHVIECDNDKHEEEMEQPNKDDEEDGKEQDGKEERTHEHTNNNSNSVTHCTIPLSLSPSDLIPNGVTTFDITSGNV